MIRTDPWRELVKQGLMSLSQGGNPTGPYKTWGDLARVHCEGRNQGVMDVLLHLQMMRRAGLVPANGPVETQAAIRQMEREPRTPLADGFGVAAAFAQAGLTPTDEVYVRSKAFTTQDAHCLPCQVNIASQPIQAYLAPPRHPELLMEYAHLNGRFGVTHRMPTLFNESDSQAEAAGLIEGLKVACKTIMTLYRPGDLPSRNSALLRTAYGRYVQSASKGIEKAIKANRARAERSRGGERMYRLLKATILSLYKDFTHAERPEQVDHPGLIHMFELSWGAA